MKLSTLAHNLNRIERYLDKQEFVLAKDYPADSEDNELRNLKFGDHILKDNGEVDDKRLCLNQGMLIDSTSTLQLWNIPALEKDIMEIYGRKEINTLANAIMFIKQYGKADQRNLVNSLSKFSVDELKAISRRTK